LISIDQNETYSNEKIYDIVLHNKYFKEADKLASENLNNGEAIFHVKHFIKINDFSKLFYDICVVDF